MLVVMRKSAFIWKTHYSSSIVGLEADYIKNCR